LNVICDDGGGRRLEVVIGGSVAALVHELIELGAIPGTA
jgi:hypothetical protein